jgi:LSD1 subclass zinc finger protein
MPDTADYPHAVLGHTEMTRWTYNTATYTTWRTPLQFPRPATGVTESRVKCSYCGRVVRWRVLSAARASLRRWSWVGLMLLCVAAFIVGIKVGSYQTGGPDGPGPTRTRVPSWRSAPSSS